MSLPDPLGEQTALPERITLSSYRLQADLGPAPGMTAVYLPGIYAHARVAVNGTVVVDHIREPLPPRPRGADRLLLARVPMALVRPGLNEVEVTLASTLPTNLSTVWIGDEAEVRRIYERKLFWQVHGPVTAAAVIMALSLCVLVLAVRQPQQGSIYAYFGIGGLLWALHTVWTVLPDPILRPPHLGIWWTMGFAFFCAPLVVFCVRLARWRLPRFETAIWTGVAAGPLLLYAAAAAGVLAPALMYWRLVWLGIVAEGVLAVGRYAVQQRNVQGTLLMGTGALALAFGVRDWLADRDPSDNNPIFLTSFSGLLFFPLVAWILIDGFVKTARELEQLNVELEGRVRAKSLELSTALDHMRVAKDVAEAANRAKGNFLAAASHDLRQPAHALGLYLAALRGERLSGEQAELVERMTAATGALDAMFNALLDISRVDAGTVEVNRQPFELAPLLHRMAAEFAQEAAVRGLRFSVRVSAAASGLRGLSDPVLVERIVRNLLGNAVKYTLQGGVLLTCRLSAHAPRHWRIEVWDTGPGIAAADQERVFDEFFQLDSAGRRSGGSPLGAHRRHASREGDDSSGPGLGLGLSIVRRLAQLLDHAVRLHSIEGRGSRFLLELPVTTDAAVRDAGEAHPGSLDGLGVGVIDDDRQVGDAMRELLERWGCVVTVGESAEELLQRAGDERGRRLQVLIVDYQLRGGHNGIEAIAEVRRAYGADVPTLIVSGASAPDRLTELQASGFDWVTKPVPPARLRSWLVQSMQAAAGSTTATVPAGVVPVPLLRSAA